jgi:hypothetical protein
VAKPTAEDPMVAKVFDKAKHEEVARAIQELSPEEANFFLVRLEAAIKKRKIQITGYLVAMGVWVVGMFFALVYFGLASGFVGWVFLAPFAAVGLILWAFGKWGERIGRAGELAATPDKPAKPAP